MSSNGYYMPVRPPRGSKVCKDSSGRLLTTLAELSVIKQPDDKKKKIEQLKRDYGVTDAKLVQLISGHREELSVSLESFSEISDKIKNSRKGCHDVKEKLSDCKKLLECKRNEIKRLWLESVEHREVISMLKEIKELSEVNVKVQLYLKKESFVEATELLVSSFSLLDGKLSGVDALKDLKAELHAFRENLHQELVKELHKYLYSFPFLETSAEESRSYEELFNSNRMFTGKLPIIGQSYDFSQDPSYKQIAVVLDCVSKLNRLPETVEILKEKSEEELNAIVQKTSKLMFDALQNSSYNHQYTYQPLFSGPKTSDPRCFLLNLLENILDQFKCVALRHQSLLDNLERIMMTKGLSDIAHYEMADIYSKIQAVIEKFVTDYLDLHNTAATHTQRAAAAFAKVQTVTDISCFFIKGKNMTRSKKVLFKFDNSHAISMKSYSQEHKDSLKEKGELDSIDADQLLFICQPTAKNITVMFKPLKEFIAEIEFALEMDNGMHCPLHSFVLDCVKVFLDEVNIEVNKLIDKISISLQTWIPVTDPEQLKAVEAKTQILNSTLTLYQSLKEIQELILYSLPDYSSHFIQLVCTILQTYKDTCYGAYKELIRPDSEEKQIFSVSWAKDKDISRLLRSLPNWTKLQESTHDFEAPEEIRNRNKEESKLLIQNLSCKDTVAPCEIISDSLKLKNLALLHESMEWLSSEILAFAETLPDLQSNVSSMSEKLNDENENPESTKSGLKELAKQYEDLADTCLLVLHLELRVHCFYYLLPLYKQSSCVNRKDSQEPEPEVIKLNNDLSKIDEALAPVLQVKKIRYIFEGLGELLATILINYVSSIKKINENGVKRMGRNVFAIQQNLASITMTREVSLDRARQYFDLLNPNHTVEDILNQIVEKGPQFQEPEYSAAIQLLYNSRTGMYEQEPLFNYLDKLQQILGKVAVSV